MKFQVVRTEGVDGTVVHFSGEMNYGELSSLELSTIDKCLLSTPLDAPAADQLLVLEMLFRRHAERREKTDEQ